MEKGIKRVATIDLTNGGQAIVDEDDLPLVRGYPWYAQKKGHVTYACAMRGRHVVYMHRLILPDVALVDHRNRDGLDNRRDNLRASNKSLNSSNAKKREHCSSKYKGVSFDRARNRWYAYVNKDGCRRMLGRFKTEIEAAEAYNEAALELFGDHCLTNNLGEAS